MTASIRAEKAPADTVESRSPKTAARDGSWPASLTGSIIQLHAQAGNRAVVQLLGQRRRNGAGARPIRNVAPIVARQPVAPATDRPTAKPAAPTTGASEEVTSAALEVDEPAQARETEPEIGGAKPPDPFDHDLLRAVEVAARIAQLKKKKQYQGSDAARLLDLVPHQWIVAKTGMVRPDIGNVLVERWLPARAKQIAFKMLDQSEVVARREVGRYSGLAGQADARALRNAAAAITPFKTKAFELTMKASDVNSWDDANQAQAEYEGVRRAYGARFPILLAQEIDYAALATASDYDVHLLASGTAGQVLKNIDESRENLRKNRIDIWDLAPVIAQVKATFGIEPGSYADQIIEKTRNARARKSLIANLVTAALQIGLGLVAVFATGGVALVALGAGAALSTAQAVGHIADYDVKKAASGSSIDIAYAISSEAPGFFWLAVDIVGAVLDIAGAVKAFRSMISAAHDLGALRQAALTEGKALESQKKLKNMTAEQFADRIVASAKTARSAVGRRARLLTEMLKGSSPRVVSLLAGEPKAMLALLKEWGSWKGLMSVLEHGGPTMSKIGRNLLEFRSGVVKGLAKSIDDGGVGARLLGGASYEFISDVDLQVASGRLLIETERRMAAQYGRNWQELFRMAVYTDADRLFKYADVMKYLPRSARAALQKRITALAERLNLAKMLRHAGSNKQSRARVEAIINKIVTDEKEVAEIRKLAKVGERAGTARRDELLLEIDALTEEFATASKARKIELAEQITQKQMEANVFTKEAYVSPGAGREAAAGVRVASSEAYQSGISQLEMIEHIVHEAGGDIVKAAREYELFKYINRFATAAARAGVRTNMLAYFENLSEYIYRVYRTGHADIPTGLPDDWLKRPFVRPSDREVFPVPHADDAFLKAQFDQFSKAASDALPAMKKQAAAKAEEWTAGSEAVARETIEHTAPPLPTTRTTSGELPRPTPTGGGAAAGSATALPARPKYQSLNPAETPEERRIGELLHRDLREFTEVYGAKEVKKEKEALKGTRSGDYRAVRPDGTLLRLDLYEPRTARLKNAMDKIIDKNSQADVVVVKFGEGATKDWGVKEAEELSTMLRVTPNHDIQRVIFIKGDAIFLDRAIR